MSYIVDFVKREDGPTTVEYAVMLSLIVCAALIGIVALGTETAASFSDSSDKISTAIGS
jgi:pilus assembly protein Flp/PilA